MAKKFKDYYDTETARLIAKKIKKVWPAFNDKDFVLDIQKGVRGKTFLARQDVFVQVFEKHLKKSYKDNIKIFTKILGPELKESKGMFTHGYWLWPIGRFVEKNGDKDFDTSIKFIYELTKRFTGEFAIRPLLEKYSEKTLQHLERWSKDKNVHVRRLSSEGMRLALPWAKKSDVFLRNFKQAEKILDNLKNDNDKFVQKSVGNNLNDLYKTKPNLAEKIMQKWEKKNPTPATLWIIKHGRRSQRGKASNNQ